MLQDSLKPHFKTDGFKKKGAKWGFVSNDLAKFFNIQCSHNSEKIYFNIGIYLQTEGKVEFPSEVDCHLRFRLEQLLDSEEEILKFYELSNFEYCTDTNERVKQLSAVVLDIVLPLFRGFNSIPDIINSDNVKSTMYWNNGKEILEKLSAKYT
jgi:hypothetical protein